MCIIVIGFGFIDYVASACGGQLSWGDVGIFRLTGMRACFLVHTLFRGGGLGFRMSFGHRIYRLMFHRLLWKEHALAFQPGRTRQGRTIFVGR
ncbi:hypothetical protein DFH09DRAFT_1143640 [Mycena vulgaris]|nr:hypothetical protein DFH09DRAFT_1143640 [Mycena vulgaris]